MFSGWPGGANLNHSIFQGNLNIYYMSDEYKEDFEWKKRQMSWQIRAVLQM